MPEAFQQIGVQAVVKGMGQYKADLDAVNRKTSGIGKKLGGALKMGAMVGGAAVAGLGVAAVKMAVDFEKSFAEVKTLLPDVSEKAFGKLQKDIIAVSREMGIATNESIPALYQAISAGVPPENVTDFMRISAKAAVGGVTDLETAVDGISSVVNAYGSEVIDAQKAADIMFTGVKLGKTTFEELSASLFQVIPTAASMGVTFEDVTASLAALTGQGVPTSVATTQLRMALVEASKGGTKLDSAIKELTDKSFAELIKQGEAMPTIFQRLRTSMPEQEFKDLFGSVEGLNAVLGITGKGFDKTSAAMEETRDSAGAVDKAFATIEETTAFKLKKAMNSMKLALMEVGVELLPAVVKVLEVLAPVLQKVLPGAVKLTVRAFKTLWKPVALLMKVAKAAVKLFKAIGKGLKALLAPFKGLIKILKLVGLFFKYAATHGMAIDILLYDLPGPIRAVVLALGKLIAKFGFLRDALRWLIDMWQVFTMALRGDRAALDDATGAFRAAAEVGLRLGEAIRWVADKARGAIGAIDDLGLALGLVLATMTVASITPFASALGGIASTLAGLVAAPFRIAAQVTQTVVRQFTGAAVGEAVGGVVGEAAEEVVETTVPLMKVAEMHVAKMIVAEPLGPPAALKAKVELPKVEVPTAEKIGVKIGGRIAQGIGLGLGAAIGTALVATGVAAWIAGALTVALLAVPFAIGGFLLTAWGPLMVIALIGALAIGLAKAAPVLAGAFVKLFEAAISPRFVGRRLADLLASVFAHILAPGVLVVKSRKQIAKLFQAIFKPVPSLLKKVISPFPGILGATVKAFGKLPGATLRWKTAIAGLSSGIIALVTAFSKIPSPMELARQAALLGQAMVRAIGGVPSLIGKAWDKLPDEIKVPLGAVAKFIAGWVTKLAKWVAKNLNPWPWIKETWGEFVDRIEEILDWIDEGIRGWVRGLASWLGRTFKPWNWVKAAWDTLVEKTTGALNTVVDFFSALPGRIVDGLGDVAGTIGGVFSGLGQAILDSMGDLSGTMIGLGEDIIGWVVEGLTKAPGIASTIGGAIRDAVVSGINWVLGRLWSILESIPCIWNPFGPDWCLKDLLGGTPRISTGGGRAPTGGEDRRPGPLQAGTPYWKGGLATVGERGSELVALPRGTAVYSHAQTVDFFRMLRGMAAFRSMDATAPSSMLAAQPAVSQPSFAMSLSMPLSMSFATETNWAEVRRMIFAEVDNALAAARRRTVNSGGMITSEIG